MSPVHYASQLKRPVYIMHGKKDVRVTVSQARALKAELEKHKKPFKYVEFPDVGHWFVSDQVQKNQAFSELIRFFDEHLQGKKN